MFEFIDWDHLMILTAINAIGALGYYITLSSGQFSVGHGALYSLGAYVGGLVAIHVELPTFLYLLAGFVAAAVPGYLLSIATARLRDLYFAVATYGFGGATIELIQHVSLFNGPFGLGGVPMFTSLPFALAVLACVTFMVWQWDRSLVYLLAAVTRSDQDVAVVLGIDVRRLRRAAFALGAGLAGVSGVLYVGNTTIITPADGGFEQSLALLLMVVIGGTQSWRGPLLGAAIWTLLPEMLRFASTWRLVIFGAIAVLLMAVRPEGILGRASPGACHSAWTAMRMLATRLGVRVGG